MFTNRRYLSQAAALLALFCAAPAFAQSLLLSSAPLNPLFIEYRDKPQKVSAKSATSSGHSLGFIPAPMDLSHDKGKKPPRTFRVKAYDPTYDLRSLGKITPVKDQGSCGSCWAFSAIGAVESRLKTGETWDFSENNLKDTSGFDYDPCFGGQHFMALAYLSRWSGAWAETADPYSVVANKQSPSYPSVNSVRHIQEANFMPDRANALDNDGIKAALTTYGAVQVSYAHNDAYYTAANYAYYQPPEGTEAVNHAVDIVGWDDNFDKSKFQASGGAPAGNGAFILKNNWGTTYGDNGYFYMSYYNKFFTALVSYPVVEDSANYNQVYQYDPLGWVSAIGYGSPTGWMSNVFTASAANTKVSAVSFYTTSMNATYTIRVYTGVTGIPTSGVLASEQTGSIVYAGYHTVPLNTAVPLTSGQKFAVVVGLTTPGYNGPIPVESRVAGYSSEAAASAGQSYVGLDGSGWADLTTLGADYLNANVNLKAFTTTVTDATPPANISQVNDGTGADIAYLTSTSQLSANWLPSSDAESGIVKYKYAIGTTPGATNVMGWTDNGQSTAVTVTGLSLSSGQIYYFSVKAQNGAGLQSTAANSNGQTVDTSAPSTPGAVSDGTGADIAYVNSASQLSANWTAAADAQSGIVKYWYAIGTSAGGTDTSGWADNGNNLSVTKTGLTLANGQNYYFTVKAENGAGLQSGAASNSNGQKSDTTAPSAPGAVSDGTGADITYVYSATQLSANWTAAADAQSGIVKYWYAIGTTAGGTETLGWTDNGSNTSVTKTGLTLANGQVYYFTVKAENGAGQLGTAANSNGQISDTTAPSAPGSVNDGTGSDITYVNSLTQLSANWTAATDAQSGIVKYWYAIGTTAGGTELLGWTDNGNNLSVTKTGLTLANGQIYYFIVKAENGAGQLGSFTNSNGQTTDTTAPSAPGAVSDGAGADITYVNSLTQLSANWTAAADAESGIVKYWYAIGTTAGGTNVAGWTDNGSSLSVTKTGLTGLADGQICYFTVKAENGMGLQGAAANSNGQMVDTTAPSAPGAVSDGTGADITYVNSLTQLSANWTAGADAHSGIARYWYAIGTTAGGTELLGWTDNGANTSVTKTGLTLNNGQNYYFTVKAENGSGLQSGEVNSNGQKPDTTAPSAPGAVSDGTGADITYVNSLTQLSANWTAATDAQSGIARYLYAIGTTAGGTNVVGWTDNGGNTSVTQTGLTLANGQVYYFTVKAENGSGLEGAAVNSSGQTADNTAPSSPGAVSDGTGADITYVNSLAQLSANWTAATDGQSGIVKYWYAVGTTAGGTETLDWTDNGGNTSVTQTGLTLANGQVYYFSVRAENGAGQQGPAVNSDGQTADNTAPSVPGAVSDGTGADITYVNSLTQLSANWTAASDAQSGIAKYWYAIGTAPGGTGTLGWTDNGNNLAVTKSGLTLANGQIYYFSVRAENGAGQQGSAVNSNGQTVNTSGPTAPGAVSDGTGADITYVNSLAQLSANWTAASDASGIAKYWYAIGTTAGGTETLGWTDNGNNLSVTKSGLTLANGQIYYFTVKAESTVGLLGAAANSNGQTADTTAPSAPGAVSDGAGADAAYVNSTTQLSANWTAAADAQSGIAKYWYAIGTTAGATDVAGWTDNGGGLSVTRTGLTLADGQVYYFSVKADNGIGLQGAAANSNGQTVDMTAPSAPGAASDGTGADITYVNSLTQLSANWTAAADAQSFIAKYWYAIGTTAGGTETLGWTDNGNNLSVTKTGLTLANGQIYHFSVKAQNGAGQQGPAVNSDGQTADTTAPSAPGAVSDGAGADITYVNSLTQLSANWTAASDAQSGIVKYWYAIGTTVGGTQTLGWTDNGGSLSVTKAGLSLANGQIYYFTVRAENGAGQQGAALNSNGQTADNTAPSAPGTVNDGTGADISETGSLTQLSSNWTAGADGQSGIVKYWYAIGTTAGGTELLGWTDNGANTSVTKTGLTLVSGQTYYFTVKAENGVGLQSAPANSNGQLVNVDLTPPSDVAQVRDGAGADVSWSNFLTQLSANWDASADAQSGIAKYWYAIGTTAGATDVVAWTDNGNSLFVTKTGLSLANGQIYYFTVKAQNGAALLSSPVNSNGQTVDATAPSAPGAVSDGAGADLTYVNSLTQLTANWTAATDAQSGVVKYWYAIGTTAGGTETLGWTDNGSNTSVTKSGLTLADGQIYYFTVKAENGAGQQGAAANSNGQTADTTAPSAPGTVSDGAGADITYVNSLTQLTANWTAATDAQSGIVKYWYAIGTTPGGTETFGWTDNGGGLSVTKTGLSLADGQLYYFTVKAENGAGQQGTAANSNGQTADTSAPSAPGAVNDGTGADISETWNMTQLSANWTAGADAQSGIVKYWYAIGTTAGGTELAGWTDNGNILSVTRTGLTLVNGQTYYFTVKAENGAGLQSPAANSDGQLVNADATAPAAVAQVRDGAGADVSLSGSLTELSANWDASSDAQSGIARYWYAIGTTAGGTEALGWADNGNNLSVTKTGLSLLNGIIYYFSVKAENGSGLQSAAVNTDGQKVDTTAPSVPGALSDGTGADLTYVNSLTQLSANWAAASDLQSGIVRYWYAIGTTAGGAELVPWTDNGNNLSVTKAGLTLVNGQVYYFTVKAENGVGLLGSAATSDGQMTDTSAPSAPGSVNDGTGPDISATWNMTQLSANWTAGGDAQSGIVKYWYAIGTTAGGTEVAGWTDNGGNTSVTRTGLTLVNGETYYFTVKAENGVGLQSPAANSNGALAGADGTPPVDVAQARDGAGEDTAWSTSQTELSANWDASFDGESGVVKYWYAIGTAAGATNTVPWTDNGDGLSVTKTGLNLANGQIYFFTVKAENGAGLQSTPVNSDGQTVDKTAPSAPGAVNDGTGADIGYTHSNTQLAANWTAALDAQSGIAKYWYAIGTTAGGINVIGWTDNGTGTSVTRNVPGMANGQMYYFTVKAVNGAGQEGPAATSDGQMVDATIPTAPSAVNDGAGADIDHTSSFNILSANWAAPGNFAGTSEYLYAIGVTAGGTEVTGWTSNGTAASLTRTGLSLAEGATYYFAVKVRNLYGADSAVSVSDGQLVDITSPTAKVELLSALPLASGAFTLKLTVTDLYRQAAAPSLSFTAAGGERADIALAYSAPGVWAGSGFIDSLCSTGTAVFSFSASDLAGNAGTVITQGNSFLVDTVVSSATGGTVSNSDGSGVVFPAAAYTEALRIYVSTVPPSVTGGPDASSQDSAGVRTFSLSREFTARDPNGNPVTSFNKPVTIHISWPDADNDGRVDGDNLNENLLRLYYLNTAAGRWVTVEGSRRDNALNTMEADVTHFSVYAVRSIVSSDSGLAGIKAYPNPCYFEEGPLTISGIPADAAGAKVLIYNTAGELVRTLRQGDGLDLYNLAAWDGKNSSGSKAASGLYIYLIKTDSHGKATGKFAILW